VFVGGAGAAPVDVRVALVIVRDLRQPAAETQPVLEAAYM
jgi:hypothetical protein